MPLRFINCSACKGCHTGRRGKYCQFVIKTAVPVEHAGAKMASVSLDPEIPDKDSDDYEPYLARRIREEEERLDYLQNKTSIAEMEAQLAQLRIKTASLDVPLSGSTTPPVTGQETGVASAVLTAARPGAAGGLQDGVPGPFGGVGSSHQQFRQRTKDEKETLSKLRAMSHLPEVKPIEKITYRDFICAMSKVAQLMCELGVDPTNYISHMVFISSKAALNLYATDAMIKYESAVTDRVISGQYKDWVAADPECVALHLGADATYAVRQGGGRWSRQSSAFSGNGRDFSDWPKEVCWLFNHTSCYFPVVRKLMFVGNAKKLVIL